MLKKNLRNKIFFSVVLTFTMLLYGCAAHRICVDELKQECKFCSGTGKHEYQLDFWGRKKGFMKCHVCRGDGIICLKSREPINEDNYAIHEDKEEKQENKYIHLTFKK